MEAGTKKALNMNIRKDLIERVERFRFRRMFRTRTEAIEFLLDYALKHNPKREGASPTSEAQREEP